MRRGVGVGDEVEEVEQKEGERQPQQPNMSLLR